MQLAFSPQIEAFVQRQLSSGKYANLVELLSAGLELLQQQESINLRSLGIDREKAALIRANLTTFADDWDSPEMSIYDNYDAAKAKF